MKTDNYIRYTKAFDNEFEYVDGDLGVICNEEGTIFKVWSPLAERVEINLFTDDRFDTFETYELVPQEKGTFVWETTKYLHGTFYDYTVYRDGNAIKTADPYAIGCACNGKVSQVVDLTKTNPDGFEADVAPEKQAETIIYELHVKDFSYDPDSGVPEEYRGKYKAFTVETDNESYPTGVAYLKELGITHVHLLPVYDFGSVDEAGDNNQFNWGYDPVNYNVPEGSYATNPHDSVVRIREFKEMVQSLHKHGIRVVMDVVYNHTYQADSWLERMAPGYYSRRNEDGSFTNGSGCGNDIAAGRAMVDNYIVDSVLYWAKEYHIDGFRFDLMGLLTVELMNRIRRELDAVYGKDEKLLYGEPWRAMESPMEEGTKPALKVNVEYLDEGVAMFSDDTRDLIKGHVFYEEVPGFVNGGIATDDTLEEKIFDAVVGWCNQTTSEVSYAPKSCAQIIQYTSAHDNFTLWDKLVMTMHGGFGKNNEYRESPEWNDDSIFTERFEDVVAANKLAALMYFTCQGHLFMQAGEEYGRTKLGDSNSYQSSPEVNMLRWHHTVENADILDYYKGLIRLRKKLPGLCDKTKVAAERISDKKIYKKGVVSFQVDNRNLRDVDERDVWDRLLIAYNATDEDAVIAMPEGNWSILADAKETDCRKSHMGDTLSVMAHSGIILGREM